MAAMSNDMSHIAVIIPCYNEAMTIATVIDSFKAALPGASIYVYDNNSTDESADIARAHKAYVKAEPRQGKGNVVRQMFRDIDAECYLMVDGDDTYDPQAAQSLCEPILNNTADLVVGDRLSDGSYDHENKRAFHGFGNRLACWLIEVLYHYRYTDVMSGYRAMSRAFVKTFPILSPGFEIETELSIHAVDKRWRIEQVPIVYRDRPAGSFSKIHTFSDGTKILRMIASLFKDYKPLPFFLILSLISLIICLLLGIPVILEFMQTGLVPRFPTAILAVAFGGLTVLFFTCGMILDTVVKGNRRQWELEAMRQFDYQRDHNQHADKTA